MKIRRMWMELRVTRVMLHKQVSICCITFGAGKCWRHAGTRLSKFIHFGWQFASCRCSSELGQTHWSWLASRESLTCRWVVGTDPSTTGWIYEKVFARWVPKNFTDYHKDHMGHSCKHLIRSWRAVYTVHRYRWDIKNHVTPKTKETEQLWLRTIHYLSTQKISERWHQ